MKSITGKSANKSINVLELPMFVPKLFALFPDAEYISAMRGALKRTGGNTFAYMMIGNAGTFRPPGRGRTARIAAIGVEIGCNMTAVNSSSLLPNHLASRLPDGWTPTN